MYFITSCRPEFDIDVELSGAANASAVSNNALIICRHHFPAHQSAYYHLVEELMRVSLSRRQLKDKPVMDRFIKQKVDSLCLM